MKKRAYIGISIVAFFYILSYVIYRNNRIEIWSKNEKSYVIFPQNQKWIYYLYRPLSYVDGKITGMRFHIGPHQEM